MNKDDGLRENRKVRKPTEEEIAQEHQELEKAGWEYVEEAGASTRVGGRLRVSPERKCPECQNGAPGFSLK